MRRLLLALPVALGLLACARAGLPVAGPSDVSRAGVRWPGTSSEDLARGRQLYAGRCGSCHLPVAPHEVAPQQWPGHVDEMKERAGLSDIEAELVRRYLVTMADSR